MASPNDGSLKGMTDKLVRVNGWPHPVWSGAGTPPAPANGSLVGLTSDLLMPPFNRWATPLYSGA